MAVNLGNETFLFPLRTPLEEAISKVCKTAPKKVGFKVVKGIDERLIPLIRLRFEQLKGDKLEQERKMQNNYTGSAKLYQGIMEPEPKTMVLPGIFQRAVKMGK